MNQLAPGIEDSKLSIWEACQDQKDFIARCSIKPSIGRSEFQRLVRILGGAERILIHPLDSGLIGLAQAGGGTLVQDLVSFAQRITGTGTGVTDAFNQNQAKKGLFSFFTNSEANQRGYGGQDASTRDQTRAIRQYYASLCLLHFPRFVTGGYSVIQDDPQYRQRTQFASNKVVLLCEEIVNRMEPLGDIANKYITRDVIGQRNTAPRVGAGQYQGAFIR